MDAVERWFGDGFAGLDPLLQKLHREGAVLTGTVAVTYGDGLAGWLGSRVARRFGIPAAASSMELRVDIRSSAAALHWNRRFGDSPVIESVFRPVGSWPNGYWIESTGGIKLALRVDTSSGGWSWQPFKAWFGGVRLPMFLIPRVAACKKIERGAYVFHVGVTSPLLGLLFSYSGALMPHPAAHA